LSMLSQNSTQLLTLCQWIDSSVAVRNADEMGYNRTQGKQEYARTGILFIIALIPNQLLVGQIDDRKTESLYYKLQ